MKTLREWDRLEKYSEIYLGENEIRSIMGKKIFGPFHVYIEECIFIQ